MTLTIKIAGREAIPVRAIPVVTSRRFSADVVVDYLSPGGGNTCPARDGGNLRAYRLVNGVLVAVSFTEWVLVAEGLKALIAILDKAYPGDDGADQNRAAWVAGSVEQLPAGVFVWLDDLDAEYRSDLKCLDMRHADGDSYYLDMEDASELGLDLGDDSTPNLVLNPPMDGATKAMILDGFAAVLAPSISPLINEAYTAAPLEAEVAPVASGAPEPIAPDVPVVTHSDSAVGIVSSETIEKFRLGAEWGEKLRKPGSYKYLLPALAQRGQRGGDPHRWNPARFGAILIERKERKLLAVSTVIFHKFAEWGDEWQSIIEASEKGIL